MVWWGAVEVSAGAEVAGTGATGTSAAEVVGRAGRAELASCPPAKTAASCPPAGNTAASCPLAAYTAASCTAAKTAKKSILGNFCGSALRPIFSLLQSLAILVQMACYSSPTFGMASAWVVWG